MPGYTKIMQSCEETKMLGLDFIWIDTCCINKTSSAELSEAINSMYKWYKSAAICFAYLGDVEAEKHSNDLEAQLTKARWFTRGWTLQELLAPESEVVFYNRHWTEIGTRQSLVDTISLVTDISTGVLLGRINLHDISVAQRMSWASKRETTRTEDVAYCLMGIFDVNMPTLYGEGDKAFIRLQYEIMKSSYDHSLFAWTLPEECPSLAPRKASRHRTGLLSSSPRNFSEGRAIRAVPREGKEIRRPFAVTNHGLHIWLPMKEFRYDVKSMPGIYQTTLDCEVADKPGHKLAIYLQMDKVTGQYYRIYPEIVHFVKSLPCPYREIFVMELYDLFDSNSKPKVKPPDHRDFRLHLPRITTDVSAYNILHSSVDDTQKFIDIGERESNNLGNRANFLLSAKADPSVQAMIVVGVSSGLWVTVRGQPGHIDSDTALQEEANQWVHEVEQDWRYFVSVTESLLSFQTSFPSKF